MQERRKEPRKPLMAYTQVFDLYGGRLLGYLADLTLRGAMVIGDRAMTEDSRVTLAIELPELENIRATRLIFSARVVWCDQDISPQYFNIGFEFLEMKPSHAGVIQALVQRYEFRRDIPNYQIKPSATAKR